METDMATVTTESILPPLVLRFGQTRTPLTDAEFYEFCQSNRDWRIERDSCGDFIIMPPAGGESGRSNAKLIMQLGLWNERTRGGEVFDSSTGFTLPNGAIRAPDAAWVRSDRWNSLTLDQKKKFPPLAPDFIVELRSESDSMRPLRVKMREFIQCGARLGWLIDPIGRRVEIFRPGKRPQTLNTPDTISGEPELAGFTLDLAPIWTA